MNKEIIKGHWKELKGKIKQEWGKLTDDDIKSLQGTYEELEGLLQKRYGYKKDEIEKSIEKFTDKYGYKEKTY